MSQPAVARSPWRSLIAPGIATLIALAILIGLGTWQLQRKAWKEILLQQIESRSHGEPGSILPEREWPRWRADQDEFRIVRLSGEYLHQFETPVYGLAPGIQGSPLQGFFLMTPLRLRDGSIVMINRGIVPTPLKELAARPNSQPQGTVTVTGLVRAPQSRNMFTPADDPAKNTWFTLDPAAIAQRRGLERVAPFFVEASNTAAPSEWPKGGQSKLDIPNNHLQYAFTWFCIALTLIGVFGAFASRKLRGSSPH